MVIEAQLLVLEAHLLVLEAYLLVLEAHLLVLEARLQVIEVTRPKIACRGRNHRFYNNTVFALHIESIILLWVVLRVVSPAYSCHGFTRS